MEETIILKNPITGTPVDEVITEKEARKRGYFDLQFRLRHLEDDNEFVNYFIVEGKKIIVELERPYLNYKKKTQINHERVLGTDQVPTIAPRSIAEPVACSLDDDSCISCSG